MEKDSRKSSSKNRFQFKNTLEENGWVTGSFGDYHFQAKVYDTGSKYGIDNGRVSKLCIWRTKETDGHIAKHCVVNYDRGWDVRPESVDDKIACAAILLGLENSQSEAEQ